MDIIFQATPEAIAPAHKRQKPFINSINKRNGKNPLWKCNSQSRNNAMSKVQLNVPKKSADALSE